MRSSATEISKGASESRVDRLRNAVQGHPPGICTERALLWTRYHRKRGNRRKPAPMRMAEALREVLLGKTVRIYPEELIVGNFSSRRVGGSIFPELHGIAVLEDIFKFMKRKTSPLLVSGRQIRELLGIVPFWIFRFLAVKVYRSPLKKISFVASQLRSTFNVINELGGISHVAPDYEKLLKIGTEGISAEASDRQNHVLNNSEEWYFYEGVKIVAEGLALFGERYAGLADAMARDEQDPIRRSELEKIAEVCRNVPRKGAGSFHEALQSLFFAQVALNLESLDNSVCPGRMDLYLLPYYERDMRRRRLTRETAKELLSAFSIKMSEIIPVFSRRLTRFHGGMFNGQVVTVGGTDGSGKDSTNELSYIFLEVMDGLRMRQPNYHARIHSRSPRKYLEKINSVLAAGGNSPALYNDDVIVKTMLRNGYTGADARNYTGVGCVEPVSQGKSFSSTDAAIVNVPLMLELALNEGRRFGRPLRSGVKTRPVREMKTMEDVKEAFEAQMSFRLERLIHDLQATELANRKHHPTPLTSMLLDGCIESGKCSTAGGARYNFSGVQCVAPADTGDALYAIERAVFKDERLSLQELVRQLKGNLGDPALYAYLRRLDKYGNDREEADRWAIYVMNTFSGFLKRYINTRGGRYVAGLYSVTAHQYFGEITGAMAHGRRRGESFSSGVSPVNGMDRAGPTALMNSVNRIDFGEFANGINFNIKFDHRCLRGATGRAALGYLLKTYFRRGGMQIQVNVMDPAVLVEARDKPELYPCLLVRVSGYSAYFNDLTPEMKDEIIQRSCISV